MLKINMFSTATKVKGQGVGSAYLELMQLLKTNFPTEFEVRVNHYQASDISHYHTINPTFYLSTFMKNRGRKIGYVHFLPETLRGSLKLPTPIRQLVDRYVIAFYRRMDQIVVVNPTFIPKLARYGIPKERIKYIPNFVSRTEFYPAAPDEKTDLRRKHGYASHAFTVICTGQVQTRKGVLDFAKLARDNPDYQFIWVGGFSFGPMTAGYHELSQLVENPPANLSFPGILDRAQLREYYQLADVFLLPSYNELFPMSVLEAYACGLPVVLRDLELYREILAGNYLAAKDVVAMGTQLHRLASDDSQYQAACQRARVVSDEYSEAHLAQIWHDFYCQQAALSTSRKDHT
ncbi:Glycosyltransferase LafB, responsible for the formation of Gal-Glc-DAG [Fructilactobacillus florum 8D]|uniref:Glycosyltransferase LafB, responsible for the formation of Gal-Glc-DAG n=1 Tax=Fructilactobacillus florum 8D TaxID=1221538 RepID=W9EK55_9LACO|nr:glycosyltransferase family 4 protein [Fructilactobacillus florum]EKK20096.1 Glycosyltransferase LafB, responsible for the formation of Gal-Glc-DAG [Fructilactobacillus florum 2F]ETO40064.1 Glycosyltransferase LafB, responsible for the formation of Gal-Glc-DAG [Fructilactobacillus florum 8D]